MNIHVVDHYESMSQLSATKIIEAVTSRSKITLGLATGATPLRTYELLINDHKLNGTSYKNVTTFNLDEYVGVKRLSKESYYSYMKKKLFHSIDVEEDNIFIPNGMASNLQEECNRYEQMITNRCGIDLQILGIGENGHIGFNEPGTNFSSHTHIVELTDSTKNANAQYFDKPTQMPTHAITMGIATIMNAREIMLLATGSRKANAIYEVLHGKVTNLIPATILQQHPNVTIIVDRDAYSLCETYERTKRYVR
ncbi:glucosamine-6-phosphate deaminase [Bacillus salitolerans]|uniref:Glucosamine-6-phosphate deaminase n=1 Tax=Bacillus salitolerans TaxID=1437434 RepID=A0ABW4LTV7_9BACI